jgi:hypothetical protein
VSRRWAGVGRGDEMKKKSGLVVGNWVKRAKRI